MTLTNTDEYPMTRVDIATGVEFDKFLNAFEAAAPAFDPVPMQQIVDSGGSWDDVRAAVARNAPNELMVYAKIDATPLLGVAGHHVKAVEYLLGSLGIAQVTEVGLSLDVKVANLLRVVGVDPGNAFAV
jgi:hypothetical protein